MTYNHHHTQPLNPINNTPRTPTPNPPNPPHRIWITGHKNTPHNPQQNWHNISQQISDHIKQTPTNTIIITTKANGIEQLAHHIATQLGHPTETHTPNWKQHTPDCACPTNATYCHQANQQNATLIALTNPTTQWHYTNNQHPPNHKNHHHTHSNTALQHNIPTHTINTNTPPHTHPLPTNTPPRCWCGNQREKYNYHSTIHYRPTCTKHRKHKTPKEAQT